MNNYATFWQRFAAMWIDLFVFVPLMVIQGALGSVSKGAALALVIPMAVVHAGYFIYCHGRFGQTLGKRVMGIRLVLTTGHSIGWREAWLRSSVDVVFSVLGVIGTLVALATIGDTDYYGVDWKHRAQNVAAHEPTWLAWTGAVTQIWFWGEFVVMLFNRRRRALHDFIAGTVVISEQSIPEAQTHGA